MQYERKGQLSIFTGMTKERPKDDARGERIRALRSRLDLTQEQVGDRMGLKDKGSSVNQWEAGFGIGPRNLKKLARALECSITDIEPDDDAVNIANVPRGTLRPLPSEPPPRPVREEARRHAKDLHWMGRFYQRLEGDNAPQKERDDLRAEMMAKAMALVRPAFALAEMSEAFVIKAAAAVVQGFIDDPDAMVVPDAKISNGHDH